MPVPESYRVGEKLKAEGKHAEAIQKFLEALAEDGTYVLAHHALAVCYCAIGQFEDAIRHAEQACELDPRDPFSFMSLSVTCRRALQGTGNPRYMQMAEDAMARSNALHTPR